MENTVTPEKKQSIMKSLALAGLLGITILVAWLAVQIVQVFPAAMTSLVGVAQSVYNYNPLQIREIEITEQSTLVNAGEAFLISWDTPHISGTYTFAYTCLDGVSITLTAHEKNFADLTCATEYDLGSVDSVTAFITTERERFTTVNYSIAFYRPNSTTPSAKTESTVTIVNTAIGSSTDTMTASSTSTTTPTSTEPTPTKPEVPAKPETPPTAPETPPAKPKPPVTQKPTAPEYEYIYTYAIPTSNPDGSADLSVSISGLGYLDSKQNFVRTDTINRGVAGAIQFIVHNLGDKTSSDWSYVVDLPGDTKFSSGTEAPLRPNERAIITVSYPAISNSYLENFSITVAAEGTERTYNNNTVGATEFVQ